MSKRSAQMNEMRVNETSTLLTSLGYSGEAQRFKDNPMERCLVVNDVVGKLIKDGQNDDAKALLKVAAG